MYICICGYNDNIGVHDPNMNGEYYLCMFGCCVEKESYSYIWHIGTHVNVIFMMEGYILDFTVENKYFGRGTLGTRCVKNEGNVRTLKPYGRAVLWWASFHAVLLSPIP